MWWQGEDAISNELQQDVFKKLLETKKYSDLTLVCEGKEFPVHKAVVCTQSSVFAAACNGHFQVAKSM
jgi:BTB/POZ domain